VLAYDAGARRYPSGKLVEERREGDEKIVAPFFGGDIAGHPRVARRPRPRRIARSKDGNQLIERGDALITRPMCRVLQRVGDAK